MVSAEDDGKILVCRADNPRFPGGSAQDTRRISVACKFKETHIRLRGHNGLFAFHERLIYEQRDCREGSGKVTQLNINDYFIALV